MSLTVPTQPKKFEKPTNQTLDILLTEEEKKAAADAVVGGMAQLSALEEELADAKRDVNKRIKELKGKINKAAGAYRTGKEFRQVDAVQHFDIETRKTWVEYRGRKYHETQLSDRQVQELTAKPLFPDADKEQNDEAAKGKAKASAEAKTEPMPANVSDIEQVRREESKKGKRDHTAGL